MSSPDAETAFDPSRSKIVTSRTFEELQAGGIPRSSRAVTRRARLRLPGP